MAFIVKNAMCGPKYRTKVCKPDPKPKQTTKEKITKKNMRKEKRSDHIK
jgi:hypothetical protein